jgi:hypothetical protein
VHVLSLVESCLISTGPAHATGMTSLACSALAGIMLAASENRGPHKLCHRFCYVPANLRQALLIYLKIGNCMVV